MNTNRWKLISGLLLALALGACATQDSTDQVRDRLAAKDWEGAVAAARQLAQVSPNDALTRAGLLRTIDQAVSGLLMEASGVRETQPEQARELYARTLALEPGNPRALSGYRSLEVATRQERAYSDAKRAFQAGRIREAKRRLLLLLAESPDHEKAKSLLSQLDRVPEISEAASVGPIERAYQRRVTLEFREAPLRAVFEILAREGGINFSFDKELNRNAPVSMVVRNSTFGQALENILAANGLSTRLIGDDTLLIYTASPQKLREFQDLVVQNFFLESADAKQIGSLLKAILKIADLHIDERRNLIVIRDTAEVVQMAQKLVATHDQPEPEVMLEVEILEVKRTTLNDLACAYRIKFRLVYRVT